VTRQLGELAYEERNEIVATIHREAEAAGWHSLTNREKGALYRKWEGAFDLTHAAVKDQIMKGFDAAQHIAPTGEAAVHARVKELLDKAALPFYDDKVPLWDGKGFVDFVFGFSSTWITVAAELESAVNWQGGLRQALWYRAAYFQHSGLEVLPGLILFGSVRASRWDEIKSMCTSTNVLLMTFDLLVDGRAEAAKSLEHLLFEGRLRI
jgi:hypothetical protein